MMLRKMLERTGTVCNFGQLSWSGIYCDMAAKSVFVRLRPAIVDVSSWTRNQCVFQDFMFVTPC
jgi:hypothetical protein